MITKRKYICERCTVKREISDFRYKREKHTKASEFVTCRFCYLSGIAKRNAKKEKLKSGLVPDDRYRAKKIPKMIEVEEIDTWYLSLGISKSTDSSGWCYVR